MATTSKKTTKTAPKEMRGNAKKTTARSTGAAGKASASASGGAKRKR